MRKPEGHSGETNLKDGQTDIINSKNMPHSYLKFDCDSSIHNSQSQYADRMGGWYTNKSAGRFLPSQERHFLFSESFIVSSVGLMGNDQLLPKGESRKSRILITCPCTDGVQARINVRR
jgi:hypothetical protein